MGNQSLSLNSGSLDLGPTFLGFPGGSVAKHLPAMQGPSGLILVQEDPPHDLGATKPVYHSY